MWSELSADALSGCQVFACFLVPNEQGRKEMTPRPVLSDRPTVHKEHPMSGPGDLRILGVWLS